MQYVRCVENGIIRVSYPMNWQPAAHASRGIYRGGDHQRQNTSNNRIDKKYLF
jgi:hypothetical protein